MGRKVSCLILSVIFIILTMTNRVYAQPIPKENIPLGPKVEDLKGREELVNNFEKIKLIRESLININITENSTDEQLKSISKELDYYLEQFDIVRENLEAHKRVYKDSFSDVFLAEQISVVADNFILSIMQQQNLIKAFEIDKENAKKLFYSNYLIPAYYYLTLGDLMISYAENYFLWAK